MASKELRAFNKTNNMAKKTLRLTVKAGTFAEFSKRKNDPQFQETKLKVLNRDRFTCQFCGFQARKYQEVINLDNNYKNNSFDNLATACCFCAQCFFLESVGSGGYGGGTVIYLPEISQEDLNSFCHVIFCAIANGTNYKMSSQAIYQSLRARSKPVEDKFGEGTSEPAALGQLILDYKFKHSGKKASELLKDLRLLPSHTKFKTQIEEWAASALNELTQ